MPGNPAYLPGIERRERVACMVPFEPVYKKQGSGLSAGPTPMPARWITPHAFPSGGEGLVAQGARGQRLGLPVPVSKIRRFGAPGAFVTMEPPVAAVSCEPSGEAWPRHNHPVRIATRIG